MEPLFFIWGLLLEEESCRLPFAALSNAGILSYRVLSLQRKILFLFFFFFILFLVREFTDY